MVEPGGGRSVINGAYPRAHEDAINPYKLFLGHQGLVTKAWSPRLGEESLNPVLYLGPHKAQEFFSSSEFLFCLGPDHEGEGPRRGGVNAARNRGVHELEEGEGEGEEGRDDGRGGGRDMRGVPW